MDLINIFWYPIPVERRQQYKYRHDSGQHSKRLERRLLLLFSNDLLVVLNSLTVLDKHNIRTLSVNVKLNLHSCEKGQKSSPKASLSTYF